MLSNRLLTKHRFAISGIWRLSHLSAKFATLAPSITAYNLPRIIASDFESAKDSKHVDYIATNLSKNGLQIIDLRFSDPSSSYLVKLLQSLQTNHSHGPAMTHSSSQGFFWEVRPEPKSMSIKESPRSETMEDFPWHTDCSYDAAPPQYFALHVLHADTCGGGTLSVLAVPGILKELGREIVEALYSPEFHIKVPTEFMKDNDATIGPLLAPFDGRDGEKEMMRCRFRADIVQGLTPRAKLALERLQEVLATVREKRSDLCIELSSEVLPSGSIVLLDNSRYFHARNEVKDPRRHLRRIRWGARKF